MLSVFRPSMSFWAIMRITPSSSEPARRRVPMSCPATSVDSDVRFIISPASRPHGEKTMAWPEARPDSPKPSPRNLPSSPRSILSSLTESVSLFVEEKPPLILMDWSALLAVRLSILRSLPIRSMPDSDTSHAASSYQMKDGSVLALTVRFPSESRSSRPVRYISPLFARSVPLS